MNLTTGAIFRLSLLAIALIGGIIWVWPWFADPQKAVAAASLLEAIYYQGNTIEAGLWAGFAIGFAWKAQAVKGWHRQHHRIAAVNFLLFGLSDIVEVQTGAWWRPWWLFLWKSACVLTMLGLLVTYLRRRHSPIDPD